MAKIRPFRGLRPEKKLAAKVAAPPYDVLSSDEAREKAAGNPYSFLHVNKPEIDLPQEINIYDRQVYEKGAENLQRLVADGILRRDEQPRFYIYKQVMGNHEQIGLVAGASVEEYEQDRIKKHELTRPDKEDDRVNHIDHLNAQVGPVFLTYRARPKIDALIAEVVKRAPEYDFNSEGVQHTLWVVDMPGIIEKLQQEFARIDYLYVADGHHRSAAAMRIKQKRQAANPAHTGNEAYNFFLTVIFPHNQMQILDYNRVVADLHGLSPEAFLEAVGEKFTVTPVKDSHAGKPAAAHDFGMYLGGNWYRLSARPGSFDAEDPVQRLDVSILQENLLAPLLGIHDPRKDKRIDFVGGIRGMRELEKRVNSGQYQVAFAFYPTSIEDLIAIADAGQIMPPKSTWFEPKLKSGLVVHLLDE
ncbi:MAG: DUF1015 domain-containing protein [Calditrichaeota bacterium]|nr:DUF1015 domain-containing protein [Calditrichota bacterium]MCB0304016.1 DUF1015 domain-containing protein [Calditrichota bacterium]MCB9087738.1 DUF1015 domain-containing protein [Calditrichia bacterium]